MSNRLTDTLNFQGQALSLRSERQRLLASNIANADTPGYVAREMDFAKVLSQATGSSTSTSTLSMTGSAGTLATTHAGHIDQSAGAHNGWSASTLDFAAPSQTNLDRNTVDMDRERASFADNSVKVEAALRFLNGSAKTLLDAIKGQ